MKSKQIWWVGIRGSDIHGIEYLFDGAIALVGQHVQSNISFYSLEELKGSRVNHNDPKSNNLIENFYDQTIKDLLQSNSQSQFFHQDQLNYFSGSKIPKNTIYNNDLKLLQSLKDKSLCRQLLSRHVQTIGSALFFKSEITYQKLREIFPQASSFIVQEPVGGGGHGTILLEKSGDEQYLNSLPTTHLVVSVFKSNLLPVNQHIIIYSEKTVILPTSAQIVTKDKNNRLIYKGCDFFTLNHFSKAARSNLRETGNIIGNLLRRNGYKGVVGIDYLMGENDLYFVEINPRFQFSTSLLNKELIGRGLPSIHEMHMSAFNGQVPHNIGPDLEIKASSIIVSHGSTPFVWEDLKEGPQTFVSPDKRNTHFSKDSIAMDIKLDGATSHTVFEEGSSVGRIETNRQILSYRPDIGVLQDSAIIRFGLTGDKILPQASTGNLNALAKLKFQLFTHGVRLGATALKELEKERNCLTIRDGIAGGLEVLLPHKIHVNVPIKEYFSLISPYCLKWDEANRSYYIEDTNNDRLSIQILPIPDFVNKRTSKGTLMVEVGQMFNERLSIEVFFGCINNKETKTACHFCELGAESEQKYSDMEDIAELVQYCEDSDTINMRHILIGGGTPPEKNWSLYFDAVKAVRSVSNKSIYMMIAPPNNLENLDRLHEMGVNEVGINLEVYDRDVAKKIMPAKGKLSLEKYLNAMEHAVSLWGRKGAIRSILIVGLEPLESTLKGVRVLCEKGVMPILSPYRPIPNTPLSSYPSPSADLIYEAWFEAQKIAEEHGQTLGPHCIACQNNTITMPYGDEYRYY